MGADPLRAFKVDNAARLAAESAGGATSFRALPTRLQVEVTNRCTLTCRSCAHRVWDASINRPMDLDPATFALLEPLLRAATEVVLGGYGDPTHSPWLVPLVRAVKGYGCRAVVITGGAALEDRLLADLAEGGLDRLVLSMDGASDATLGALRGLPLSAYLGWMATLARLRGAGLHPELQLNFVAQRDNAAELPDLVDRAADAGAVGIHVFHIKVYDPGLRDQSLFLHADLARSAFVRAADRARRRGIFLRLPSLEEGEVECRQPFETLFVLRDGEVRGCCAAVFRSERRGLHAGRLSPGTDVHDVWNGAELVQFRAAAQGLAERPAPCAECPWRVNGLGSHLRPLTGARRP